MNVYVKLFSVSLNTNSRSEFKNEICVNPWGLALYFVIICIVTDRKEVRQDVADDKFKLKISGCVCANFEFLLWISYFDFAMRISILNYNFKFRISMSNFEMDINFEF